MYVRAFCLLLFVDFVLLVPSVCVGMFFAVIPPFCSCCVSFCPALTKSACSFLPAGLMVFAFDVPNLK